MDAAELRTNVQNLQRDVESKAATIKHLQNAIEAKSMTIGILSKANREGGDLETHIGNAVQAQIAKAVKAKEDSMAGETQKIKEQLASLQSRLFGAEAEKAKAVEEATKVIEKRHSEDLDAQRERLETEWQETVANAQNLGKEQAECDRSAMELEMEELKERLAQAEEQVQTLEAEKAELKEMSEMDRGRLTAVRGSMAQLAQVEMRAASAEVRALQHEEAAKKAKTEREEAESKLEEEKKGHEETRRKLSEAEKSAKEAKSQKADVDMQQLEQERKQAAEVLAQMRSYQTKASEMMMTNDALASQLEATNDEMQAMQVEHQTEVDELRKELQTLQGDRETQRRAVTEQIDCRLREVRQVVEREKDGIQKEQAAEREKERQKLQELTVEADRLRLRNDQLELELKALHALADEAAEESSPKAAEAAPADAAEAKPAAPAPAPPAAKVRALREQSQFAFDEMSKRIGEIREEAENDKKKLRAELDQKLHERGAQIMELTNRADGLQTLAETLECERDALVQQRDELNRSIREKDRAQTSAQAEIDGMAEANRDLQQKHAVALLSQALQRGVVMPAFSLLRRCSGAPSGGGNAKREEQKLKDYDSAIHEVDVASTADEGLDDEEDEDDEDDEDEEDKYGIDQNGQEEWAEMLKENSLNALFPAADAVVENARLASGDLTEHVQNIVQSLDLFPQMYSEQLRELDHTGKGKELREFVCKHLARAMVRCQRITGAIAELCTRTDEVIGGLQNLVRVKGLEWHLTSLRVSGQYEVFLRLQRNQMAKLRTDYEDVLDQYGEQCEQNSQLQRKVDDLNKQMEELRTAAPAQAPPPAESPKPKEEPAATPLGSQPSVGSPSITGTPSMGLSGPRSMADIHQMMKEIETTTVAEVSAKAAEQASIKGPPGKGPPAKGKGKGPPPPGAAPAAAPAAEPAAEAPAEAPAAGKKGPPPKGKGKGPPPPGAAPAAAEPAADAAPAAPAGKAKGKGPPPPPGKGAPPPAPEAAAPEGGKGKKGPGAPPGKGAPPAGPGGKGPAPPGGKGPPGKGGPGAPGGKGKKGKVDNTPKADPGPEPPKDMAPKQFHWTNVIGGRFQTSIFAEFVEEQTEGEEGAEKKPAANKRRVKLDFNALTSAFFARKKAEPSAEELAKQAASKKKTVAQCLDGKKSQAVEIFLNGCGVKLEHVKSSVVELDEKAIAMENLSKVLDFYPNAEEVATLKTFQADNDPKVLPWGRAEDFLISLMGISDFKVRAESCLARGQFGEEFSGIAQDVGNMRTCLQHLVTSTALRSIFAIICQMGNYLNFGTRKGAQLGFTLDTLPLLVRVEGIGDKTYSLMRFLMDTLEMDRAVRDEALEDLKLCDVASKLDFDDCTKRLNDLEKGVNRVADIVTDGTNGAKLSDGRFNTAMKSFVDDAQGKLSGLRTQVDEVVDSIKKCIDLYAEKPKTPIAETLKKFADFRKDMEDARRTNLLARAKKEKAEKRKAEKEGAAKAKEKPEAKDKDKGGASSTDGAPASSSKPPPTTGGATRRMKVKIPDKPIVAATRPRQEGAASKQAAPKETSTGISFAQDQLQQPPSRMSMGPMSRPDMFKVSSSAGGRISIGITQSGGKPMGREEIQRMIEEMAG